MAPAKFGRQLPKLRQSSPNSPTKKLKPKNLMNYGRISTTGRPLVKFKTVCKLKSRRVESFYTYFTFIFALFKKKMEWRKIQCDIFTTAVWTKHNESNEKKNRTCKKCFRVLNFRKMFPCSELWRKCFRVLNFRQNVSVFWNCYEGKK